MKPFLRLLTILALAWVAVFAQSSPERAQTAEPAPPFVDAEQYHERMLEIDHSFAVIAGARNTPSSALGPQVQEEASNLAMLFERVEEFWEGRGDEEAAGFARLAREGSEQALDAAKKGEREAFNASVETIASSCEGCHASPLDKYRLPRR